jgi:patatin-related protein
VEAGAAAGATYEPTQEVRFAVVMYGGVSLAIYINGVVQELLHLVRATAPAAAPTEDGPAATTLLREDELEGSEQVYRELGRILRHAQNEPRSEPPAPTEPIRTRFIVDILSGSSAGGINGIFLAKALANDARLGPLKDLWVEEGDIEKLVNDGKSYAGTDLDREKPSSILNSRRMYWELLDAFRGMDADSKPAGSRSRLVDELDLWITATDLRGLMLPIGLYDRVVYEQRYRNLFHFRYSNPYSGDATTEAENQLVAENNPMLAFAARATSSFPFAFEPMELDAIDPVLAKKKFAGDYESRGSDAYGEFFRAYLAAEGPESDYAARQFGDGGYLDNKPFTASTENLLVRRADLPVDRKLIYVEPDPGDVHATPIVAGEPPPAPVPPDKRPPPQRFDALQNVRAALLTLPRQETIREDLEALLQRNRDVARLVRAVEEVEAAIDDDWRPPKREDWVGTSPQEAAQTYGFQYAAYVRLKLALLLDDLAETATILAGLETSSDERSAIRCFIQAWFRRTYPDPKSKNEFLLQFDVPYRLRRLDFLQSRIDKLLLEPGAPSQALYTLKRELTALFVRLLGAGRSVRRRSSANPAYQAFESLAGAGLGRRELLTVLAGARNESESVAKAAAILDRQPAIVARIDALRDAVRTALKPALLAADVRAAIEGHRTEAPEAVGALLTALDRYEVFDSVIVPISYGLIGESDRVEVIRVSPEDATSLRDEVATGRRKLGGIALGHFGGFFRKDWRENDILWGRLDAAERIIDTLLAEEDATPELRAAMIAQAHRAIVKDDQKLESDADVDAFLARLRDGEVDRKVPEDEMESVVDRALTVTGRVLENTPSGGPLQAAGPLLRLVGATEAGPVRKLAWLGAALAAAAGAALLAWGLVDDGILRVVFGAILLALGLLAAALLVGERWVIRRLLRPKPRRRPPPPPS